VLHGLAAVALVTAGYAVVVGQFSLQNKLRAVSDLGAGSISIFGVVVAIVLGASSLYRELELKTIFPILARPIRRSEYVVGKYFGTLSTLFVFIAANAAVLLLALAVMSDGGSARPLGVVLGSLALVGLVAWKVPRSRTYLPLAVAPLLAVAGYFLAAGADDERHVVLGSAALTLGEVGIVAAVALVFSSFSSPFLTAIFTFGLFVVGRSADTLARLPERVFGATIHAIALTLSKVVPNLMLYVPPRSVLTGEAAGVPLGGYLALAEVHAFAWSAALLAFATLLFRRRDFL
jgi:ABC-type transport system involved in multi-copper enzyme maturation permease subunit